MTITEENESLVRVGQQVRAVAGDNNIRSTVACGIDYSGKITCKHTSGIYEVWHKATGKCFFSRGVQVTVPTELWLVKITGTSVHQRTGELVYTVEVLESVLPRRERSHLPRLIARADELRSST